MILSGHDSVSVPGSGKFHRSRAKITKQANRQWKNSESNRGILEIRGKRRVEGTRRRGEVPPGVFQPSCRPVADEYWRSLRSEPYCRSSCGVLAVPKWLRVGELSVDRTPSRSS